MLYFALFIILLIIAILLIKIESLSQKNKILVFILSLVIVILVTIYQLNFNKKSDFNREKINHFNQGKTLTCKNYNVSSRDFSFFGGTNSFVAKEDNQSLKGIIIKLEDCEIE